MKGVISDVWWIDLLKRRSCVLAEVPHGTGMPVGERCLCLAQYPAAVHTVREAGGGGERPPQQVALLFRVGVGARLSAFHTGLAVGLDEGDVDPVQRCAGHQAQGGDKGNFRRF